METRRIGRGSCGIGKEDWEVIFKAYHEGEGWVEERAYRCISIGAAAVLQSFESLCGKVMTVSRSRLYFIAELLQRSFVRNASSTLGPLLPLPFYWSQVCQDSREQIIWKHDALVAHKFGGHVTKLNHRMQVHAPLSHLQS